VTEGEVTRHLAADTFTFLPLGPAPDTLLEEFRTHIGRPPQQPVLLTHRFRLAQVTPEVRPNLALQCNGLIWFSCPCNAAA
jgi:hypothetical protein